MSHERVKDVCRKVRKLQQLTKLTSTITTRSQGYLLESLSPEELIEAAEILTEGTRDNGPTK